MDKKEENQETKSTILENSEFVDEGHQTEKVKKVSFVKKNKKKIIVINIILLVLIAAFLWAFLSGKIFKKVDKNETKKEVVSEKTLEIDSALANFSLECSDDDGSEVEYVKESDTITCYFNYDEILNKMYKIKEISFDLHYSYSVSYVDGGNDNIKYDDGTVTVSFDDYYSSNNIKLLFGISKKDQLKEDNLYIDIDNIKFKTDTDLEFKFDDTKLSTNFYMLNNYYYIYRDDESGYITVTSILDSSNGTIVGEYNCDDECSYYNNGNYILFDDDSNYVLYNLKNNKTTNINLPKGYDIYQLVANDSKAYGVSLYKEDNSSDNNYYYDLTKNKITYSNVYIYYDSMYELLFIDDNTYSIDGGKYVPKKSYLEKIDGTNLYSLELCYGFDTCVYYFYNENLEEVINKQGVGRYQSIDGNLIVMNGNFDSLYYTGATTYSVYDSDGNLIRNSKEYDGIYLLGLEDEYAKYIVVIDDETLKLVDYEDKEIASFTKLNNKYFHWMISGDYSENGKDGIYLVVEDHSVTLKEFLKDNPDMSEEDYDSLSIGYEYYYIPSTGETNKISTYIGGYAKPILYLYPTKDNTKVTVNFAHEDLLTTTYPKFVNSWNVTANKNGDLYDSNGKYYYGLYWEESISPRIDFSEGFYVTKESAIDFLEEKLTIIGLNDKEKNEFIMYWLPILEKNEKSLVYFELTDERQAFNKLDISPKPDSLLRVAIHVKKVSKKTDIKEEKLTSFKRVGFTAVEWGGVIH